LPKIFLPHRFLKGEAIKVPRLAPPRNKLQTAIDAIEGELGVFPEENGRLALRSVAIVFQEMAARNPGKHGMPALPHFMGGAVKLPIIVSFDGTGFGNLSINTIAVRSPWSPQTAVSNNIIGVGKVKDDRAGTVPLLGPNLATINEWITKEQRGECSDVEVDGVVVQVMPEFNVILDVAALRHCEHMAASGWCGCSSDFALRCLPAKPDTVPEMRALVAPVHRRRMHVRS
jgi:hypothetical protein